jgi:predicted ATPase
VTQRFVLTGAPGAGKTTIVEALRTRGHAVVGEAATDVIAMRQALGVAEPWTESGFVGRIAALQRQRELAAAGPVQVFDRSPICTLALSVYSGLPLGAALDAEIARIVRDEVYDRRVLFVRPLGFITPTAARRISFEDALRFERIHEEVYRGLGYELVDVPPAGVAERVSLVEGWLSKFTRDALSAHSPHTPVRPLRAPEPFPGLT